MKVNITPKQLASIIAIKDDISGMVGGGDTEPDRIWRLHIKRIKAFIKANKLNEVELLKQLES